MPARGGSRPALARHLLPERLSGPPDSPADSHLRHAVFPPYPCLRPSGIKQLLPDRDQSRVNLGDPALDCRIAAPASGTARILWRQLARHSWMCPATPVDLHRHCFKMRWLDAVLMAATAFPDVINIVTFRNWPVVSQFPGHPVHQMGRAFPVNCSVTRSRVNITTPESTARIITSTFTVSPEALYGIPFSMPSGRAAFLPCHCETSPLFRAENFPALVFSMRDRFQVSRLYAFSVAATDVLHMIDIVSVRYIPACKQVRNTMRTLSLAVPPDLRIARVSGSSCPQQAARTICGTLGLCPEPAGISQRPARIFQITDLGNPLIVLAAITQRLMRIIAPWVLAGPPDTPFLATARRHRRQRTAPSALVITALAQAAPCTGRLAAIVACAHTASLTHFNLHSVLRASQYASQLVLVTTKCKDVTTECPVFTVSFRPPERAISQ